MRGFCVTVAAICPVAAAGQAVEDQLPSRMLPKGSQIELLVLREVNSDQARPGDPVRFVVSRPVLLSDGSVLAGQNVKATGEVLEAKKSGLALQRGSMRVALRSIAPDGVDLPFSAELQRKGKGGKADDALKLALVPMYVLFSPGNAARLKAGETVVAVTDADLCLSANDEPPAVVPCRADEVRGPNGPDHRAVTTGD